ncbi:hypothetical protein FB451DRAFT_1376472 [Mycena latifolia]|nr:hypothetical protein FB451DRAFT_1376472 [Mycena latifolia]
MVSCTSIVQESGDIAKCTSNQRTRVRNDPAIDEASLFIQPAPRKCSLEKGGTANSLRDEDVCASPIILGLEGPLCRMAVRVLGGGPLILDHVLLGSADLVGKYLRVDLPCCSSRFTLLRDLAKSALSPSLRSAGGFRITGCDQNPSGIGKYYIRKI